MATVSMPLRFGPSDVEVVRHPDGSMIVRSPHRLGPYPRAITDRLDQWAAETPERLFLAERDAAEGDSRADPIESLESPCRRSATTSSTESP